MPQTHAAPPSAPYAPPRAGATAGPDRRVAALRAAGVLDGDGRAALDRLAGLAARLVGAPTGLVTLVAADRQLLVGRAGQDGAGETPLAHALCRHVVEAARPLGVADARVHALLRGTPGTDESGVVAYAGVPLVVAGEPLGALCAIDGVPREWRSDDVAALEELARAAAAEIDLRLAVHARAAEAAELTELLDAAEELACATGADGRITRVNRAWRETLGYTAAEAAAMRPTDFVAPEHRARYVDAARRLVAGERVDAFEAVLLAKDGRRVACRGRALPVVVETPDGPRCVGTRALYRDVTPEHAAEARRARLVATLEASPDFVATAAPDGRVEYLNVAARRLLGLGADADLAGLRAERLHPPATAARLRDAAQPAAARDGQWVGEGTLVGAGGVELPVSMVVVAHPSPVPGEPPYFSTVMRDLRDRRAAEEALERERSFLAAVLDSLSENVSVCAPDGRLVLFNRATHETHGVPADGSLPPGRWSDCYRVFRPDGTTPLPVAELPHVRVLATREAIRGVEFVVDVPGRARRTLVASAHPLVGPDGELLGSVCAARDVTTERAAAAALEREREFLGAVLESLSEGVAACDAAGRLTLSNAATRAFHGVPVDQATPPERWADHYRLYRADGETPLPTAEVPLVRALRDGEVRGAEIVIATCGEPRRRVAASGRRFTDASGRVLGAVIAMHDVTDRVEAERRKSEFVTTVSHELRTPLTSISGSLALLEAGVVGALPDKARALVGIATANAERLIRLVSDVLDLDKIEAGQLEYAMGAQDPDDLVRAAADGIHGMAAGARVEVVTQLETRTAVLGDRDRLIQVLTNLLSNAIKFSPPDSAVVVRAGAQADAAGRPTVRFSVEDYGPGIPPDKVALLFQKFRQLGVTDRTRRGGTGLGLAITKAIVEQHGGAVGVASEPGRRTLFWCDLPAAP